MAKQLTFFCIYFHLRNVPEIYTKRHTDTLYNACVNKCDESSFRKMDAKVKGKSSPVTGLDMPRGLQEVKVPRFRDSGTVWW